LSDEETKSNTPVVISCNERRREVAATQIIANKQIDRTFAFDKVLDHLVLSLSVEQLFNCFFHASNLPSLVYFMSVCFDSDLVNYFILSRFLAHHPSRKICLSNPSRR
jgi:hypothetical protein